MDIRSGTDLNAAILQLETRQAEETQILKENFYAICESLKPVNLIKNTFKEVTESTDIKNHLLSTGLGLATGYLTQIIFEEKSDSPLKKLFGATLQFGVTSLIANNPEAIRTFGAEIADVFSSIIPSDDSENLMPEEA